MVSFDATLQGTPAEDWSADGRLNKLPQIDLGTVDELVVVAAHPHDETLGAGGLISRCARQGIPVRVVCVTDGAASHPGDRSIAQRRATELSSAIGELDPAATVTRLGFPDGETAEYRAEITAALERLFASVSGRAAVAVTWRGDGHRDHRVVGEIVSELAGTRLLLEFPIWMWHWAHPGHPDVPWDRLASVPVDTEQKSRAIARFSSQSTGPTPILRADFLSHFARDEECFVVTPAALGREYFESIYARSADPWRFETRWYELRKRRLTVASLPREHYQRGLEIGGSIGSLTALLAERCTELSSVDISHAAVVQARARLGDTVKVLEQDVLSDFPAGPFDLIVISEVGYYWGANGLDGVLDDVARALTADGTLVACHWRHPVADYPLSGDDVHSALARRGWTRVVQHVETDFVLEVYSGDSRSVAQTEGLA